MMDYQLTLPAIMRRAEEFFGPKEIVSRLPDRSFHRYTYADFARRAKQLALALQRLGVQPGDRVATFCWNHHQHFEAYFGVPASGAVVHTLNPRLHPDDLTYIMSNADDRVALVDQGLLPLFDQIRPRVNVREVIVISDGGATPAGTLDYERVLASVDARAFAYPELDEQQAAAMCYTSGTTGRPKGVLYSHRAIALHSLLLTMADTLAFREADVVCPVVPMFHANAWGTPFAAALVGAGLVFPGQFLDPPSLLELLQQEHVTFTAGVPTIWLGILQALDRDPKAYNLSSLRMMAVGGSAAPLSMIRGFQERHGLNVLHAWGMTELTPLGTVANVPSDLVEAPPEVRYAYRARQGTPVAFVEARARGDAGLVPWDGETMGELEVRGPWVAGAYHESPGSEDRFTADGWFKTGDIVTVDRRGSVKIQDRSKDLIKSGGEWISSVDLENALMGHPAIAEAAVIAVAHPKWQERPLAVVVFKPGQSATPEDLRAFLEPKFARWWLPDAFEVVDQIPRTAVGKFLKSALRERFKDYPLG
ncbi:MAG TPA: long-chain fatty acid--CoA ligase [Chloroflexota bacterium]|nr:long-chain fatty acid--CoA ligase [Chloroflexota bacterium]